jgi:hypothetical protein
MPLENQSSDFTYINFMNGKFIVRVSEDNPSDQKIKRTNKLGATVYELHYDKLSDVLLADIREAEHDEYGPSYEFIFQDENDYLLLRISKKSRVANMILKRLENIKLDQPFTMRGYYFAEEDKSAVGIYQDGAKIEAAYSKEKPNGLPEPKKVKVNGVDTWDWTEQMDYWSELIKSLKPHMIGVNAVAAQVAQAQAETRPEEKPKKGGLANDVSPEDEVDDLPF